MRYTAARYNVEKSKEKVELGSLSRHSLKRLLVPKLLFDFKGMWQGNKWYDEKDRELKAKHNKDYVGREQKKSVENMRSCTSDKNCKRDNANSLI